MKRRVQRADVPRSLPTLAEVAAVLAATAVAPTSEAAPARDAGARNGGARDARPAGCAMDDVEEMSAKGHFIEARDVLRSCVDEHGPCANACESKLRTIDERIPSIVVACPDAEGRNVQDSTLSIDGSPVAQRLDGSPIPVDPGAHTLVIEGAHGIRAEKNVLVSEGEKNRVIVVNAAACDVDRHYGGVPAEVTRPGGCCGTTGAAGSAGFRPFTGAMLLAAVLAARRRDRREK